MDPTGPWGQATPPIHAPSLAILGQPCASIAWWGRTCAEFWQLCPERIIQVRAMLEECSCASTRLSLPPGPGGRAGAAVSHHPPHD